MRLLICGLPKMVAGLLRKAEGTKKKKARCRVLFMCKEYVNDTYSIEKTPK